MKAQEVLNFIYEKSKEDKTKEDLEKTRLLLECIKKMILTNTHLYKTK